MRRERKHGTRAQMSVNSMHELHFVNELRVLPEGGGVRVDVIG